MVVVAPDKPQSGMGHAITINSTLRIQKTHHHEGVSSEYSCTGTPVDCVKMAVTKLLPRKPDLVLSGINHGSNSSINVIYSKRENMDTPICGILPQFTPILKKNDLKRTT